VDADVLDLTVGVASEHVEDGSLVWPPSLDGVIDLRDPQFDGSLRLGKAVVGGVDEGDRAVAVARDRSRLGRGAIPGVVPPAGEVVEARVRHTTGWSPSGKNLPASGRSTPQGIYCDTFYQTT